MKPSASFSVDRLPDWAWVVLLFALAAGLYVNTLGHDFVFDDFALIRDDPQLRDASTWQILTSSYRPVRTLTYAVNYRIGKLDPSGYHLFNVLLHAVNVVLLYLLSLRLSRSREIAVFAAVVFAVHPVQTAAVAYVSGRKDLLAAFFVLSAALLFAVAPAKLSGVRQLLAWGALVLGILSKETALVLPALLLLTTGLFLRRAGDTSARSLLWGAFGAGPIFYGATLVAAAAGFYYSAIVLDASRKLDYWGGTFLTNLGTGLKLFSHYLRLVVWPDPLIADYTGDESLVASSLGDAGLWLGGVLFLACIYAIFHGYRRQPLQAYATAWFLLALVPVLQLYPFHEIAADHFLYLPMAGAAVALAIFLVYSRKFMGRYYRIFLVMVLIATGFQTVRRNRDWRDSYTLWEATYRAAPHSYRAQVNFGWRYALRAETDQERDLAIAITSQALDQRPDDFVALANLGGLLLSRGMNIWRSEGKAEAALLQLEKSKRYLLRAAETRPDDGSALVNLGSTHWQISRVLQASGRAGEAMEHRLLADDFFRRALRSDRRDPVQKAWYLLAQLFMDGAALKLKEKGFEKETLLRHARGYLRSYLQRFPSDATALELLAKCEIQLGDSRGAAEALERAVRLKPDVANVVALAESYLQIGAVEKGIRLCLQFLQRVAAPPEVHLKLAELYLADGEPVIAGRYALSARRNAPNEDVRRAAERVLRIVGADSQ